MDEVTVPRVFGALAVYCVVDALFRILFSSSAKLPYEKLLGMAQQRYKNNSSTPLFDKVAIVTGSTSGLGQQIATDLFKMGATVILASRTKTKTIEIAEEIRKSNPESTGKLITDQSLDTSDLDSVVEFARWFRTKYSTLDILVNNAGIVYLPSQPFDPKNPPTSKQGYDAAFATNYLGHFLLTELLLPTLKKTPQARVLSVASTAHLTVSGNDLLCIGGLGPKCAPPVKTSAAYFGAYGNNKMAQMMHAQHLQREINEDKDANGLKVVCTCPGFTATGMLPNNIAGNLLKKIFFDVRPATLAPLYGLLSEDIQGGEFLTNFFIFWTDSFIGRLWFKISCAIGMRVPFAGFVAIPWVMAFQNSSYGYHKSTPAGLVTNKEACEDLVKWSREAVSPFSAKLGNVKLAQ